MRAILLRIKQCCLANRIVFTEKAFTERIASSLSEADVVEAIVNAPAIYRSLRSRSSRRATKFERLYVIIGLTHEGVIVYTKGALRREQGEERFYVLVSAKRAIED